MYHTKGNQIIIFLQGKGGSKCNTNKKV